jgi:hypothetical protein
VPGKIPAAQSRQQPAIDVRDGSVRAAVRQRRDGRRLLPGGIDIDTNGVVWTGLAAAAIWRVRPPQVQGGQRPHGDGSALPRRLDALSSAGPQFKAPASSPTSTITTRSILHNALGLGPNTPILNGTGSDSLIALNRQTNQFVYMRVPYPLGFYTRGMDFRIDDPNAG